MPEKNKIGSTASPSAAKDLVEKGAAAARVKGSSRLKDLQSRRDVNPLSAVTKLAKTAWHYGSVEQQRELANIRLKKPPEIMADPPYVPGKALNAATPPNMSLMANYSGDKDFIGEIMQRRLDTSEKVAGAMEPSPTGLPDAPVLMSRERTAEAANVKNVAMAQETFGIEPNLVATLNNSPNESKDKLITSKANIASGHFDENNVWQEGYAIPKGYVDGPEGTINFVEADIETAKSMMANSFFPPEQMVFQIETSDEEYEKLVKDPRYSQYSIERTDTKEKKREREVARIEKRLGEEQVLVSEYFQGSISQNVMTRMAKFGLSDLPPEIKKQVFESMDAAEKQFALNQSNYDRLQEQNQMSYLELAKKTGMTPVAAHSLKQEIGDILEILTPLVSMKSKREYHEDHAHLREIMSKSEGPYSQARDDYKAIIKDSKSSPAEADSAKRGLKRMDDPNRDLDDGIITAYDVNGAFCSAMSAIDEDFDMVKDSFIKGGMKTISDRMATNEERVAASQLIQSMAVAKTIKDTDLLKHLSTYDKNFAYNKLISDKIGPLQSALASSDIDGVSTIMDELINETYEKADDQGHKKGAKVYEIMVGPVKINPDTGEKDQEVLKVTDDQKRQMFLTMCTPQAKSIMNAWNLVLDDPYDRNGQYSVDEDHVIQSINELVAKGQEALARETVLNMRSIMKENGAIGLYGRSDKYLDTIDGMLGL